MKLSIRGKNNKISKKEVRYMLNFFGKILLGKRLCKNISITLDFKSIAPAFWGLSSPVYDERYSRDFSIIIDPKLSKVKQIATIAHEMVHVMQFAKGQFDLLHGDEYRWMGKKVTIKSYKKMPWETEARRSESYLSHFYREHLKLNGVKFAK